MGTKHDIIWDKKPEKKELPAAQVSSRIITINGPALQSLGKASKLCLGKSPDKSRIYIKAYSKELDGDATQYEIRMKKEKASINCGSFITNLGWEIAPKQRLKPNVTIDGDMLILSLA